jgi:hypothetical protein
VLVVLLKSWLVRATSELLNYLPRMTALVHVSEKLKDRL